MLHLRWIACKPTQVFLVHFARRRSGTRTVIGDCERHRFYLVLVYILM